MPRLNDAPCNAAGTVFCQGGWVKVRVAYVSNPANQCFGRPARAEGPERLDLSLLDGAKFAWMTERMSG